MEIDISDIDTNNGVSNTIILPTLYFLGTKPLVLGYFFSELATRVSLKVPNGSQSTSSVISSAKCHTVKLP